MSDTASRNPDEVVEYIVAHHHAYVRVAVPRISRLAHDVMRAHGDRHSELRDVADIFARLADDLLRHMEKEEQILFPWIVYAFRQGWHSPPAMFGTIVNPILMMEREHEAAQESIALIRELTDDYTPPEDACTAYRVWLNELKMFDADLTAHVRLENDVLFPAAARLESVS